MFKRFKLFMNADRIFFLIIIFPMLLVLAYLVVLIYHEIIFARDKEIEYIKQGYIKKKVCTEYKYTFLLPEGK